MKKVQCLHHVRHLSSHTQALEGRVSAEGKRQLNQGRKPSERVAASFIISVYPDIHVAHFLQTSGADGSDSHGGRCGQFPIPSSMGFHFCALSAASGSVDGTVIAGGTWRTETLGRVSESRNPPSATKTVWGLGRPLELTEGTAALPTGSQRNSSPIWLE